MKFHETTLADARIIEAERFEDERGFFARGWCRREFEDAGLVAEAAQSNISYNRERGTLRGLHLQRPPYAETKLVRCVRGGIWDVIVDLRPDSPTHLRWEGFELLEATYRMLYVPEGFAHGFITLADDTEVVYQVSEFYTPGSEAGIRWDDPRLKIEWPLEPTVMSEKDRAWNDFDPDTILEPVE